jgi:tetratricopeptide (TPR) repeat protein
LQEQLVTEVAGHLGVQVERVETEKALRKPGDLTAWEAVMRSMAVFGRLSVDSLQAGIADARHAIAVAPDYAPGYATLARTLGNLFLTTRDEAMAREGRIHAQRALALETLAPRGYQTNLALGYKGLAHFQAGRYELALQAMEEAILLHPNLYILKDKAVVCEKLGQHEDASDAIRRLSAAEPSVTLDGIERANSIVFAPDTANEMNAILRKLWRDTPVP